MALAKNCLVPETACLRFFVKIVLRYEYCVLRSRLSDNGGQAEMLFAAPSVFPLFSRQLHGNKHPDGL